MILEFLLAEAESSRFKSALDTALNEVGGKPEVITSPNLGDEQENKIRKAVLQAYRGYPGKLLFDGFPDDVKWYKKSLSKDQVLNIRFSTYNYWVELSKGTRSAKKAVETIRNKEEIFGQSNDFYSDIVKDMKAGKKFAKLTCVAASKMDNPVVIEGHSRLTAYALAPDLMPESQEVIIGISPEIKNYGFYELTEGERE